MMQAGAAEGVADLLVSSLEEERQAVFGFLFSFFDEVLTPYSWLQNQFLIFADQQRDMLPFFEIDVAVSMPAFEQPR